VFVDTHHHWVPPTLAGVVDRVAAENRMAGMIQQVGGSLPGLFDLDIQAQDLHDAGEGSAVLSLLPAVGDVVARGDAVAVSAACNDELIDAVAQRPEFARALLTLPLPDVDAALAELQRVGDDPRVGGVLLHTVGLQWVLDEARFEPVYADIARRRLPLMLHPAAEPPPLALRDFRLADSLGAMFSSTAGAARFMLSGMLDRVADLIVIVPHLGGALPYLAQRLVDQNGRGEAEHDILYYLKTRIWLDSCSYHPPALRCALDTVGSERILLGSDYPFRGPTARAVADAQGSQSLLSGNVQRLWGLRPAP
jgi:predicted TIM-barrel fold metal-dependent hydrolase